MLIDSGARKAKDILEHNTLIRRAAVKKNFKPLGYPVITFARRDDSLLETLVASVGVAKYSSIIVLSSIERWKNLALFTLRQNIYTDPQVPMQVEQKVYAIGDAKLRIAVVHHNELFIDLFYRLRRSRKQQGAELPCRHGLRRPFCADCLGCREIHRIKDRSVFKRERGGEQHQTQGTHHPGVCGDIERSDRR